jgi:hypothetical protein
MIRSAGPSPIPVPRRADGPLASHPKPFLRLGAVMNPAAVTSIAAAIKNQEGYAPGTLAYTNNNPGNLVFAGQAGATPGAGGFAAFATPAAGDQALDNQINLDATRGTDVNGNPTTTIAELIASWAPASDPRNNTTAYIASVTAFTGYGADDSLLSLGAAAADDSGDTTDASAGSTSTAVIVSAVVGLVLWRIFK